jgi:hypothetical protein
MENDKDFEDMKTTPIFGLPAVPRALTGDRVNGGVFALLLHGASPTESRPNRWMSVPERTAPKKGLNGPTKSSKQFSRERKTG